MFKERLKLTARILGVAVIGLLFALMVGMIFERGIHLSETAKIIISYGLVGIVCIALVGLACTAFYGLYHFVKWLFIEPYREHKKRKSIES